MTDVFSSLNSLIWVLIVILIVAAVVMIARAVLAPHVDEPYREPPVIQQQPVVQQPPATSGLAPGWYPDQNESNLVRYYDGRVWTSQTQPRN
ncbi:MAG TPA: DUF2510 domain-containing protein [Mycobacterium sp.]|nr:DUF2510 domain-containing protein [Mycobacterium sp.]